MAFGIELYNSAGAVMYSGNTNVPTNVARIYVATSPSSATNAEFSQSSCFMTPAAGYTLQANIFPLPSWRSTASVNQLNFILAAQFSTLDIPNQPVLPMYIWAVRGIGGPGISADSGFGMTIQNSSGSPIFSTNYPSLVLSEDLTITATQYITYSSSAGYAAQRIGYYKFGKQYLTPPLVFQHKTSIAFSIFYFVKNASGYIDGFVASNMGNGAAIRFAVVARPDEIYGLNGNTGFGMSVFNGSGSLVYTASLPPAVIRKGTMESNGVATFYYDDQWAMVSNITTANRKGRTDSTDKNYGNYYLPYPFKYTAGSGWQSNWTTSVDSTWEGTTMYGVSTYFGIEVYFDARANEWPDAGIVWTMP